MTVYQLTFYLRLNLGPFYFCLDKRFYLNMNIFN